jgi:hypothetical protein
MGVFGWLFGNGIKGAVQAVGDAVNTHAEIEQAPLMAQADINKVEAGATKDTNWFIAGWRPFLGWQLALCAGLYFMPMCLIGTYVWVHDYIKTGVLGAYPVDMSFAWELLTALLGVNVVARTVEKIKGVAR